VKHVFVKAAARVNNRAENSHQPTRRRERHMCGFRDARRTQALLSCFGPIRQHFALPRHRMNAACHLPPSRNVSPNGMVGLSLPQVIKLSNKDNYS
jgi:putative transposase